MKIMKMRVFHGVKNIANQPAQLARALRELGIKSYSAAYADTKFPNQADFILPGVGKSDFLASFFRIIFFPKFLFGYDIFHFHTDESLLKNNLDLPILKFFGKKIMFHFRGSEVRNHKYLEDLGEVMLGKKDKSTKAIQTEEQKQKIKKIKKYANKILVSTPDLLDLVGNEAEYIPNVIDLEEWPTEEKKYQEDIIVVHAPSSPRLKGTEVIEAKIRSLIKDNHHLKFFILKNNYSPEKKLEIFKAADLAIDQLLVGWYGNFSIEMMALGKVVMCYIRQDLKGKFAPDLPIINIKENTLPKKLTEILNDKFLIKEIGNSGRKYVDRTHSKRVVLKKLIKIYKEL